MAILFLYLVALTVDSGLNNPSLNEILNSDIGLLLDVSPFELNLNEILNLFVKVDKNEFNINVNNILLYIFFFVLNL